MYLISEEKIFHIGAINYLWSGNILAKILHNVVLGSDLLSNYLEDGHNFQGLWNSES